ASCSPLMPLLRPTMIAHLTSGAALAANASIYVSSLGGDITTVIVRSRRIRYCDTRLPAHIGLQRNRNIDAAVGTLVVFQHGDQCAPHCQAGAIERVQQAWFACFQVAVSCLHAPSLKIS